MKWNKSKTKTIKNGMGFWFFFFFFAFELLRAVRETTHSIQIYKSYKKHSHFRTIHNHRLNKNRVVWECVKSVFKIIIPKEFSEKFAPAFYLQKIFPRTKRFICFQSKMIYARTIICFVMKSKFEEHFEPVILFVFYKDLLIFFQIERGFIVKRKNG